MNGPVLALLLTTVVHLIGMVILIRLMGDGVMDIFRTKKRGWDDGGSEPPAPDAAPAPTGGGDGLPLPDAESSRVRLREPGRIADGYERRPRRPEHEPAEQPQRDRELV